MSLTGTGTAPGPVLSASPASLSFPSTLVGSSPATQTVTVTNSGTTAATVSSVAVTGAFSQTNNCTTHRGQRLLHGDASSSRPPAATNTGTLTVASNANNNPLTVGLSGTGITSTTNLALNQPITACSYYETYVASNVDRRQHQHLLGEHQRRRRTADHHGHLGSSQSDRVGHRPAAVLAPGPPGPRRSRSSAAPTARSYTTSSARPATPSTPRPVTR